MSEDSDFYKYLEELHVLEQAQRAIDGDELYEAKQHFINNPLISEISKVDLFNKYVDGIRRQERRETLNRVIALLDTLQCGCDGDCDMVEIPHHNLIKLIRGLSK